MPGPHVLLGAHPARLGPPSVGDRALDLLVFGSNLTARLGPDDVPSLLRDLAEATAGLARGARRRATLSTYRQEEPWEIGLERVGGDVLVSVYRAGPEPEVAVHERSVAGTELREALLSAIDEARAIALATETPAAELELARTSLLAAPPFLDDVPRPHREELRIQGDEGLAISLSSTFRVRVHPRAETGRAPLRGDLHALLVRGTLELSARGRSHQVGEAFVLLEVERLVALAGEVLAAWLRRAALHRRVRLGDGWLGVRLTTPGALSLVVNAPQRRAEARTHPALAPPELVRAVVSFGRALVRALLQVDSAQAQNLRLLALRGRLQELSGSLCDALRDDALVNPAPESYRAFAQATRRRATGPTSGWGCRLRYTPRWTSVVPEVDLRATFLCGDRLLVGGIRETVCLDAATGEPLWCRGTPPGVSLVAPGGLVRVDADGGVTIYDLGTGEIVVRAKVAPRVGRSASGLVVAASGLPQLVLLTEGRRRLAALDVRSGDIRWRYAARAGSTFRLRRAGRLVIVSTGTSSLEALDLSSGDVVWRFRDPLGFAAPVALDRDALFAASGTRAAGDGACGVRLHHLDAWSGEARWSRELPGRVHGVGAPLVAGHTVALAVEDARGSGLLALDRASGDEIFRVPCGVSTSSASWLAVDDAILVNASGGVLLSLDARTGRTRWRHVFGTSLDGAEPRRLEPVLRSGALFVPQRGVHVVRPADGEILGQVETDLIPDLLRVNERCDVFVVEDSGHLAAFTAIPRLTVVR